MSVEAAERVCNEALPSCLVRDPAGHVQETQNKSPPELQLRSRGYVVSALAGVGSGGRADCRNWCFSSRTFSLCQRDVAWGSKSPNDFGAIERLRVWPPASWMRRPR